MSMQHAEEGTSTRESDLALVPPARGYGKSEGGPTDVAQEAPAAPQPRPETFPDLALRRPHRRKAVVLAVVGLSLQLLIVTQVVWVVLTLPIGAALLLTAVALEAYDRAVDAKLHPPESRFVSLVLVPLGLLAAGAAGLVASISVTSLVGMALGNGFHRGRQVRVKGKLRLPGLAEQRGWAEGVGFEGVAGRVPVEVRAALADRWRRNGATEHASVAAFAKLTLDLVAVGAPPELLAAASRDASDEIRHAEACFALARAIDGHDVGPREFPEALRAVEAGGSRQRRLEALAVDSLLDGALYEGVSARLVAKLARRSAIEPIAALLRGIAADEGRHAAHAWDVVAWCAAEGGAGVLEALREALRRAPREIVTDLPPAARGGGWEPYGIHGQDLERAENQAALAHLEGRVEALAARLSPRRAA